MCLTAAWVDKRHLRNCSHDSSVPLISFNFQQGLICRAESFLGEGGDLVASSFSVVEASALFITLFLVDWLPSLKSSACGELCEDSVALERETSKPSAGKLTCVAAWEHDALSAYECLFLGSYSSSPAPGESLFLRGGRPAGSLAPEMKRDALIYWWHDKRLTSQACVLWICIMIGYTDIWLRIPRYLISHHYFCAKAWAAWWICPKTANNVNNVKIIFPPKCLIRMWS